MARTDEEQAMRKASDVPSSKSSESRKKENFSWFSYLIMQLLSCPSNHKESLPPAPPDRMLNENGNLLSRTIPTRRTFHPHRPILRDFLLFLVPKSAQKKMKNYDFSPFCLAPIPGGEEDFILSLRHPAAHAKICCLLFIAGRSRWNLFFLLPPDCVIFSSLPFRKVKIAKELVVFSLSTRYLIASRLLYAAFLFSIKSSSERFFSLWLHET